MGVFYISSAGSDSNTGASDTQALLSVSKVNAMVAAGEIRQGDSVLFRRGDTFYGKLSLSAATTGFATTGDYCSFGAYGPRKLSKPILSSYKLLNDSSAWTLHSAGVWKLDLTNPASFGGFSGVTPSTGNAIPDGTDIGHLLIDGVLYGGRKFGVDLATALNALTNQWDFYCDKTQYIYVKSSANPATLATSIKAACEGSCVVLGNSLKISGLRFEGTGSHAIAGQAKHVRVYGCELALIGGAVLDGFGDGTVRFGNGVELSMGSTDFYGAYNDVSDVYDVGYTMQGNGNSSWTDCHWRFNRHRRCSQNLEFWSQGTPAAGRGVIDCTVERNDFGTCENRWTVQNYRPGGVDGCHHILLYDWQLGSTSFMIRFNTFRGLPTTGGQYHYMLNPPAGATIDYNRVFLPAGAKLSGHAGESAGAETTYTVEQSSAWVTVVGTEANSKFFVEPANATTTQGSIQHLAAHGGHVDSRLQGIEQGLASVSGELESEVSLLRSDRQQRVYTTLASSAGNQFARLAIIRNNGVNDKTAVTLLVSEAGDSNLSNGVALVHFKLYGGGTNVQRIVLSVTELVPFLRAGAALGTGPWFKASNFSTRLSATDNANAHEAELWFSLSDTFEGLQFVKLTEFKSAGSVRLIDQDVLSASVPADYSTGAPSLVKVSRYYNPHVTATDTAYAASITPVWTDAEIINVGALTGNLTVNAPTGGTPHDGQQLTFRLAQDATGGRTITWNAAYAFGTDVTTAMIPTTASASYEIQFRYNATAAKWRAMQIVRGF